MQLTRPPLCKTMQLARFDNGECYQDLEKAFVLLSIVFHVVTVKVV